jgi:hypothetical protein
MHEGASGPETVQKASEKVKKERCAAERENVVEERSALKRRLQQQ